MLNCHLCSVVHPSKSKLDSHLIQIHLYCGLCKALFKSKNEILAHLQDKHSNKVRICSFCSFSSINKSRFFYHGVIKHKYCFQCQVEFNSVQNTDYHMKKSHPKQTYLHLKECHQCHTFLGNVGALNFHREKCGQSSKFQCNICSRTFAFKSKYEKHVKLSNGKLSSCHLCAFQTCSNYGIQVHQGRVHGQAEEWSKALVTQKHEKQKIFHVLPRPKKGKWIVKLMKIDE